MEDFVSLSQALVINIGTLFSEQIAACKLAAMRARAVGVPWILDPVGAGATPYRRAAAEALARLRTQRDSRQRFGNPDAGTAIQAGAGKRRGQPAWFRSSPRRRANDWR
ncbi:MAG: hydroxyethylthiazole kinase [Chromatiales bacterium]|nr:hydroxyethylthiazole kinase [Chromatiales bacterium]